MTPRAHRRLTPALLAAVTLLMVCAPTAACAATATAAVTGRPAPGAGGGQLTSLSCPTAQDCWAVGGRPAATPPALVVATTDGAKRWHRQHVTVGSLGAAESATLTLAAVSCSDTRDCMAAGSVTAPLPGGAVAVTTDGGRVWSSELGPPGDNALVAVACSAPGACTVVAVSGTTYFSATTSDGGATWQHGGDLPPFFGGASSIVCSTAGACAVAGYTATSPGHGAGAVAVTGDDGTTWSLAGLPAGTGVLHAVTCTGAHCLAVGTTSTVTSAVPSGTATLLESSDGGATYTDRSTSKALDDGLAVGCAPPAAPGGPAVCAATGIRFTHAIPPVPMSAAVAMPDPGTTVRALTLRYTPSPLTALSCPTATRCVAVGGDELATITLPSAAALRPARPRGRRPGSAPGHGGTTTTG